jgi:hypothetical protein
MTLLVNDLSVSKELDGQAMSDLNGGFQVLGQGNSAGSAVALTQGGIGNVALALNLPTQINVGLPINVNLPTAIGVAGNAVAI